MTTARMLLPLSLIALAVSFAAVVAYGTHPAVIEFPAGLSIIMLARRLQWPLVTLSLIASLALLVIVISGKRRAWWLIGLAPVLALLAHRFAFGEVTRHAIADDPKFVACEQASFLGDEDYVVGLTFADQAYAYPYAALYWTPLVVQSDRDQRLVLAWSAFANTALATTVSRDIKPRELDIVCEPANALLIYNSRIGQFINGLTGRTPGGAKPLGFGERLTIFKGPWKAWKSNHPSTYVMVSQGKPGGPGAPVLPREPYIASQDKPDSPVVLIATTRPAALASSQVTTTPINVRCGDVPLLIFRDPSTGQLRAFDRHVEADLIPRFVLNGDPRRKGLLRDLDTNTCWSANGVAVDGEKDRIGKRLTAVDVQDQVYLSVAKYWWPKMEIIKTDPEAAPQPAALAAATTRPSGHALRPARPRRRR